MRSTHAVWAVTDAFDAMDLEGLGERVSDATGTGRVLGAPRTPTRAEREEDDVSHVSHRPWCRFCVMGRGSERRRHLTETGDHDGHRPRVFVDFGCLSGDSTPWWLQRTGARA